MNELAGQNLAGYLLEEELGRDSMGVVYRGKQMALGREVAIKMLPRHLLPDPSSVARFIRGAQIIAGLSHPHIIQIYDAGQQNDVLYVVMENVEGPSLRTLLSLDGRIPAHLVVEYGAQIADALDAAYQKSRPLTGSSRSSSRFLLCYICSQRSAVDQSTALRFSVCCL